MLLGYSLAAVMYFTAADRSLVAPPEGECTANPADCPARTFCYRQITTDFFPDALKSYTAIDDGVAVDKYADYADDEVLGYACACYALMGEGGDAPLPGGPEAGEGGFCNEASSFKGVLGGACYAVLAVSLVTFVRGNKLIMMLKKAEALQFNASGITMILVLAA
jgi:hypothetical protein